VSDVAKLIADMARAGVDPELIGRAAAALAEREPVRIVDEQAERRRAADRERKRLRNSAESDETADIPSPKKETSPAPLKEKTTPSTTEPNGSSKTRATRLPADWTLPVEWRADAVKAGLPQNRIDLEAEKMRDWSISSPNGAKREWRSAWRNWVKGAADKLARGSPSFPRTERPDHFANHTRDLIDGQDRSSRSHSSDWDDAQSVPVLAIDYERR
jgi:hypothetical protein